MKATLKFNLPEDEYDYNICLKAPVYRKIIMDMWKEVRDEYKYGENPVTTWEGVKSLLLRIINENDKTINDELP